ncbi:unnamed protein product [marine sediment metagenome]|uniref:DNA (cytosine-5-)-methyltransferase n=1 Tax=marine sediment metagenome TaxID=412755 RepID=X1B902_9ZZZZ
MNILLACEESQAVCKEFRKRGHEAYSCDILPCSGGHPEWHIKTEIAKVLNGAFQAFGQFWTEEGTVERIDKWDMVIAFPPCTYLTVTGNKWFNVDRYGEKAIQRKQDRLDAIEFFMSFANYNCGKIVIENPIGVMSTEWRKPDQIIHPYYFGDPERKSTCLWLKGVQPLKHDKNNHVEPNIIKYKNGKGTDSKWHMDTMKLPPAERSKARSKTFPGIAKAMATQWGN